MKPDRTDPAIADVLDALRRREPIFHRPEFGTTRAEFEAMTAVDFREVGASGRTYSREQVLEALERRHADVNWREEPFEATEFHCRSLAGGVFLLTYALLQGQRRTRRATVWQRSAQGWIALYHQGTVVAES